jgi:hypothetical protein
MNNIWPTRLLPLGLLGANQKSYWHFSHWPSAPIALETIGRIDLSEAVSAKTRRGAWVQIRLRDVPEYAAALALARESYRTGTGVIPQEQFSAPGELKC